MDEISVWMIRSNFPQKSHISHWFLSTSPPHKNWPSLPCFNRTLSDIRVSADPLATPRVTAVSILFCSSIVLATTTPLRRWWKHHAKPAAHGAFAGATARDLAGTCDKSDASKAKQNKQKSLEEAKEYETWLVYRRPLCLSVGGRRCIVSGFLFLVSGLFFNCYCCCCSCEYDCRSQITGRIKMILNIYMRMYDQGSIYRLVN